MECIYRHTLYHTYTHKCASFKHKSGITIMSLSHLQNCLATLNKYQIISNSNTKTASLKILRNIRRPKFKSKPGCFYKWKGMTIKQDVKHLASKNCQTKRRCDMHQAFFLNIKSILCTWTHGWEYQHRHEHVYFPLLTKTITSVCWRIWLSYNWMLTIKCEWEGQILWNLSFYKPRQAWKTEVEILLHSQSNTLLIWNKK